jgi:hypothetical protein
MTAMWRKARRSLFHNHGATSTDQASPGHIRSFPNDKRKIRTNLMQISPETTPPKPSSSKICIGTLTLADEKEIASGKLLDLKPKVVHALPPRNRAHLSSPPPARTSEERGPVDRRRKRAVALEITFSL